MNRENREQTLSIAAGMLSLQTLGLDKIMIKIHLSQFATIDTMLTSYLAFYDVDKYFNYQY